MRAQYMGMVLSCSGLAACSAMFQPTAETLNAPTRQLTAAEQGTLGHQISLKLKDPNSAMFQWPPIVLKERSTSGGQTITDYCGFVNAKNAMGGYVGFDKFYGWLSKGPNGDFTSIEVRILPTVEVPDLAEYACLQAGYGSATLK